MTCLHCAIKDAILNHFDELGRHHGDHVIVDAKISLEALAKILAEMLAAIDDEDDRSRVLARFLREAIEDVNDIRAAGLQPSAFKPC